MNSIACVVSYRNSTSNHNLRNFLVGQQFVVSYRNSTSNHNLIDYLNMPVPVVSYRNSTSNHNDDQTAMRLIALYLIEILHQTTTYRPHVKRFRRCILSKFYIKPQRKSLPSRRSRVVSYRNSTSNHNSTRCRSFRITVVSYRNSTSNHNVGPHID